uniref:Uncharacterized protein n=1 Tax=Haematobia irritans TaxID=7368 RepID=A0A1L8E727_HAEIR
MRTNCHHLVLNTFEILYRYRFSFGPFCQITINGTTEFHTEIRVGKGYNLIHSVHKFCHNAQAHQTEQYFGIFLCLSGCK